MKLWERSATCRALRQSCYKLPWHTIPIFTPNTQYSTPNAQHPILNTQILQNSNAPMLKQYDLQTMSKKLKQRDLPRNKHIHLNFPPKVNRSECAIATRLRETELCLQVVLAWCGREGNTGFSTHLTSESRPII